MSCGLRQTLVQVPEQIKVTLNLLCHVSFKASFASRFTANYPNLCIILKLIKWSITKNKIFLSRKKIERATALQAQFDRCPQTRFICATIQL